MPNANQQGIDDPADPGPAPGEVPEEVQMGDDQMGADDAEEAQDPEEPRDPGEPLERYEVMLQGFRTITQILSAAYGAAWDEIQAIVLKSLAKTTAEDRTFVWGASGAIRQWLTSVKPAMDCMEKSVKDQAKLLAEARKAGKDALDSILELIPEEEGQPHLTPVFPKATPLLAPVLTVARRHTDEALWNIHTQLVDLGKEHIPQEHAGAFFNTILQVSCSFRQEMDNMATNQVLLPCQIVPNLWGSHRGLLEGLSLLGPPSCSASWPASLVERVTAVPSCQNVLASSKTPTKSNLPSPGAAKTTPDSRKKPHHLAKKATGIFWKDDARGKEDAEARKLEEKHWKKSSGPVLSLGNHEESISNLLKWAPPSQVSQPPGKAPSSGSQQREKARGKHVPGDQSDDDPLSDRANEPRPKSCKQDPTPELVVLDDDDNAPLPGKAKGTGKKARTQTSVDEEAIEVLSNHLKGEVRAVQYNLELATLVEYRNLHIPNLKGPPNIDDHSAYLSVVKDVSWSYPAKGNLITARQYYQDLKASKDPEAIEAG